MIIDDDYEKLTVKDIAEKIAYVKTHGGVSKVIRQLRHWTAKDLLKPIGGKSTGTGNSRLYNEYAFVIAAILFETSRYGLPLDLLKHLVHWVEENHEGDGTWGLAMMPEKPMAFLQIAWEVDPKSGTSSDPKFYVFDDTELLWGDHKEFNIDSLKAHTSSIVINLSKLFDRIYPL
jgi:DNA-binding transcriptional MerR regulator